MDTYRIIRFHFLAKPEIVTRGLTLEQVQAHCHRDDTHGGSTENGTAWFDGYEKEESNG